MLIRDLPLGLSLTLAVVGCGASHAADRGDGSAMSLPPDAGSGDAAAEAQIAENPDPDPVFSAEALTALQALHYDAVLPPTDPSDRVADDVSARAWGQRLFFDPAFSGPLLESDNDGSVATLGRMGESGRVSCAGCHIPDSGFVDTRSPHRQISLAAEWSRRRTPGLLEVAFAPLYSWDGRRDAIWNQAVGVMENMREFNSGRLFVAEQVFSRYRAEYEALFGPMPGLDDSGRFPPLTGSETGCQPGPGGTPLCRGVPGDHADYDGMRPEDQQAVTAVTVNTAKTIEAYVRELRCGAARFDAWLDGDSSAMSRAEQRGAALFVGRGRCVPCHGGPRLTDDAFHNVGMAPRLVAVAFIDTDDHGALSGIAAALADPLSTSGPFSDGNRGVLPAAPSRSLDGAFRTPGLRCIARHPSYMHTAQMATLDAVVSFFASGGDSVGYPGVNELARLDLTVRERADLVAFLAALEGPGPDPSLRSPPP
jgi:cytochrome c peroxidase